jgi:adenylyltransferase/sulfurtransferase
VFPLKRKYRKEAAVTADSARETPRKSPELSREEILRYSRHILLPEVGVDGQKKLKDSAVLLVGAGGLGSPAAMYLAAAGVGHIGVIDHDRVDVSNLQRQILHRVSDIGRAKTESAKESILGINPHIRVTTFDCALSADNALEIFRPFPIIVDGTDNFAARFLVNDACALSGKPDVYGAVYRFEGQATVFDARRGACLRCLMPEPPAPEKVPTCGEGGVLGVLPGIVGSIQAAEVLRLILDGRAALHDRLLTLNAWDMRFHTLALSKNPDCPLCGRHPRIQALVEYEFFCAARRPADMAEGEEIGPAELKARLEAGENILLVDVRLPAERLISSLPGALCIPLEQLAGRMGELDPGRVTVFVCKKGEKSAIALEMLREEGYAGPMLHLAGGLNAWAAEVEPGMAIY